MMVKARLGKLLCPQTGLVCIDNLDLYNYSERDLFLGLILVSISIMELDIALIYFYAKLYDFRMLRPSTYLFLEL